MFNPWFVLFFIGLYVGLLFIVALWVEHGSPRGRRFSENPWVYSFALAVYCTSWTFYGSVGSAASSGMLFLTIYLGPTLAVTLWWFGLRKLVRIKSTQRITSIADFISARYGKSQLLAAIASMIAIVGITPYIALQLKAILSTFTLVVGSEASTNTWSDNNVGLMVVVLMIIFTIIFGVRRLDPTERHQGVVMALAIESMVKLVAFLAVGIFVTFFLYDGFDDLLSKLSASSFNNMVSLGGQDVSSYLTWMSYLVLAMSAIVFLPRQFHIAVIENSNEKNIRTAVWLFPLYLFLINIFVVPIAAGGLLQGYGVEEADTFVLTLPLFHGQPWLALLVFIGGFSAATGMVIVSAMTLATMFTNHLLLPIIEQVRPLGFLRYYLLQARWLAVATILITSYSFEQIIGDSYTLVNMGIISFAAVLQFAPSIIGGLYWRRSNQLGAILGLVSGFLIWFYTLLLPSFIKSGWLSTNLLTEGPWGIEALKPEHLFGLVGLESVAHTVFWTMLFNISLFILGSLYFEPSQEERRVTESFVDALKITRRFTPSTFEKPNIDLANKLEIIKTLLSQYLTQAEVSIIIEKCLDATRLKAKTTITITQLADLSNEAEKYLAGSIGAAIAYQAFRRVELFTQQEAGSLSKTYNEILADLKISPQELREKISYYRERDMLMAEQATILEKRIRERTRVLEVSAKISRQLITILDINELLQLLVNILQTEFNYYHAHIYLVNEATGDLVIAEGTGEVAQKLKAKKHHLASGQGIVGTVASTKLPFKSNNVDEVLNFIRNPLLPNTKSELAVPLLKGDQVLGVLDIQSEELDRFSDEDITMMQSIGNQMAIAVDNARLLNQFQTALQEVERLNHRLTREGWNQVTDEISTVGYRYNRGFSTALTSTSDVWVTPMKEAVSKKTVVKQSRSGNGHPSESEVAVPLILRNEVIGVLGIKREETPEWAEEELLAVEAVADQVSRALENARLAREQEKTIEQLKEIDRLKSEFLTSMSHELRTPLNSIIGFADVLLQGIDGDLPEMATHDIRLIHNSGQHLLALINDILDLSKIEAGKMELVREPLDISESINDVLAASNSLVKDKPVKILVDKPDSLPFVYADKLRLNQILLNLISNAAKFTHSGSITIKANIDQENSNRLRIAIIDTGIGIPLDKQRAIFDRFRQADGTTTRKYGGTGLGLAISLNLTHMHGGELMVNSQEGVGSEFYFTIPLADQFTDSNNGPDIDPDEN
ncbi:MAG: GAF domain-containing protein [Anaerolineae bacterium]|nr:GAF domain-containing protein [Anaerolineae bacterium]